MTGGSSRKPLIRSHSGTGSGPAMRNWPLFVFLTGLVFFFYLFYIYQAQSTDLSLKKEQLDLQIGQVKILKDELVDVRAELEKLRASEGTLKTDLASSTTKLEECTSSLRQLKLKSDTLNDERTALDTAAKEKTTELTELRAKLSELERNHSSLQMLYESQLTLSDQLNKTIQVLKSPQQPAAVAQPGAEVVRAATEVGGVKALESVNQVLPEAAALTSEKKELSDAAKAIAEPTTLSGIAEPLLQAKQPNLGEVLTGKESGKPDEAGALAAPLGEEQKKEHLEDNAKEDNKDGAEQEIAALQRPAAPGDRVKMEEEVAKEGQEAAKKPVVQGGEYIDKADEDLVEEDKKEIEQMDRL